jgi:hypothetical protein
VPADLRAGDLVALHTTGAYTYSMASNYNRFGRPPVVFVRTDRIVASCAANGRKTCYGMIWVKSQTAGNYSPSQTFRLP